MHIWVSVFLDGGSHCSYRCGPSAGWRWGSLSHCCSFYTTTFSSLNFLSILDPYPYPCFLHLGDPHGSYAVLD